MSRVPLNWVFRTKQHLLKVEGWRGGGALGMALKVTLMLAVFRYMTSKHVCFVFQNMQIKLMLNCFHLEAALVPNPPPILWTRRLYTRWTKERGELPSSLTTRSSWGVQEWIGILAMEQTSIEMVWVSFSECLSLKWGFTIIVPRLRYVTLQRRWRITTIPTTMPLFSRSLLTVKRVWFMVQTGPLPSRKSHQSSNILRLWPGSLNSFSSKLVKVRSFKNQI